MSQCSPDRGRNSVASRKTPSSGGIDDETFRASVLGHQSIQNNRVYNPIINSPPPIEDENKINPGPDSVIVCRAYKSAPLYQP